MPGSPMIGVGSALRSAREGRSRTIDEAARDTKIRSEYLEALESESFDTLMGDAHVRGFLRSYSQYLGLDPDKVLAAYSRSAGEQEASSLPEPSLEADRPSSPLNVINMSRSWALAGTVALMVMVLFAMFGFLSRSHMTPPPAPLSSDPPSIVPTQHQVSVGLIAKHEVQTIVTADGQQVFSGVLHAQEARAFDGIREITVQIVRGGVVTFKVNGEDIGRPGDVEHPYSGTFYAPSPTPTPTPTPTPSTSRGGAR